MTEFEAAFFTGDFRNLRSLTTQLLSEKGYSMWVQLELFV
jgi:hypothetical protein